MTKTSIYPALLLLAAACGGGGGGGGDSVAPDGASAFTNTQFVLGDSPVDDLLSFSAVVASVRLEREDGTLTDSWLSDPVELELTGLRDRFAFLATSNVTAGAYTMLHVAFQPNAYTARRMDGTPVAIAAFADELVLPLAPGGTSVQLGAQRRLEIDVDLRGSIGGDVTMGLTFRPEGSVTTGAGSAHLDALKGVLRAVFEGNSQLLLIDAFVDDDLSVPLGQVVVDVNSAWMADKNGNLLDDQHFFPLLVPGTTILEVRGTLAPSGVVIANRVDVEADGGSGLVELEGDIVGFGTSAIRIRIRDFEKGATVAQPVLAGQDVLEAVVSQTTTRVVFDGGQPGQLGNLSIGQRVDVRFDEFTGTPFRATRVEIEDPQGYPTFRGTITGLGNVANSSFTMRMRADDPSILSGLVQSSGTDVDVFFTQADVVLATRREPAIDLAGIVTGMGVEAVGVFFGDPMAPDLQTVEVRVRPGALDDADVVGSGDPRQGTFETTGGTIADPFGGAVVAGPMRVVLAPECDFRGEALTSGEFFSLIATPPPRGVTYRVDVAGVGSAEMDLVTAYEVELELDE